MAKDPYKYFRVEARELLEGLSQGVLLLEKSPAHAEAFPRLLRLAHTLKGAARVVRQPGIAELAHAIEGALEPHRDQGAGLPSEVGAELLRLIDEITARLHRLEVTPEAEKPTTAAIRPPEDSFETVRIEVQEMDGLLRSVTEAGVQLGAMRRDLATLERVRELASVLLDQLGNRQGAALASSARLRSFAEELQGSLNRLQRSSNANLERAEGDLAEARDVASRLRLVPASTLFPALDRAVRDAAHQLGKRVEVQATGGEVRLDASMLAALRDALLHVVRNGVAHGVESESERIAAGKSPVGRVRLDVTRRGSRASFVCSDDGRGINFAAVRRKAVAKGLVAQEAAGSLSTEEVIQLLLRGGLTTADQLTEISGRGIGLDVVRETATRLKGTIGVRSDPGQGTTVEIVVPVSIASLVGLVVEAAGAVVAIPLECVRQTLRIQESDIARSAERDSLIFEGKVIPFLPLQKALRRAGPPRQRQSTWSAVVVRADERVAAIGVDRCLGTENVVMRTLPAGAAIDPIVGGAALDAEGNPQLVLDPAALIAAAEGAREREVGAGAAERLPILVVDDSLTTRMLERSILESAGYRVEEATSAEEALTKCVESRYALFLVDVEMPGMDGFDFVGRTRADPVLRETPAILVTSRNAPEDRRRGEAAGARAYIVKGEFDQVRLLSLIHSLVK